MTRTSWVLAAAAVLVTAVLAALLAGARLERRDHAAAAPMPVRPAVIGVNLGKLSAWEGEYAFANLLQAASVSARRADGSWGDVQPGQLDPDGWPVGPSTVATEYVMGPPDTYAHPRLRCSWTGKGLAGVAGGNIGDIARAPDHNDYTWNPGDPGNNWVDVPPQPAPPRGIDCREKGLPRSALFAPAFLKTVAPFKVLRFVDWQAINGNKGGDWSKRSTLASATQTGPDGVAIEAIVALVNRTGADPWLIIPYNADDRYVTNMARYVHDHLHAGGTAYVEFGNELWNVAFPAAQQAQAEGLAEGLSADPTEARLRRYAEKAAHALAIWTRVFADRPRGLVRIVSTQNAWPHTAEIVLSFRDTARFADALATAPYFSDGPLAPGATADTVFAGMDASMDKVLDLAAQNRAVAARYGKRYLTYEAGQSITSGDTALLTRLARDPRMGAAYARLLRLWRARFGDTLMLYNLTDRVGSGSSIWGLQEQTGQPIAETPRLKAVYDFIGR